MYFDYHKSKMKINNLKVYTLSIIGYNRKIIINVKWKKKKITVFKIQFLNRVTFFPKLSFGVEGR